MNGTQREDGTMGYARSTSVAGGWRAVLLGLLVLIAGFAWLAGTSSWTAAEAQTTSASVGESAWAWGRNNDGQLGDGTTTSRSIPVKVQGMTRVTQVDGGGRTDTGESHSLALTDDGKVWAWGRNSDGQLGDGTTASRALPTQVQGVSGVKQISAGGYHSLALKDDGTVWAWGSNGGGQLGDGTTTRRPTAMQVLGPAAQPLTDVKQVSAGIFHSLAVKNDGTVWAWGSNAYGQLGDGYTTDRPTAVQVQGVSGVKQVSAGTGTDFSLALKDIGTVWGWGYNFNGELGDGTTTNRQTPVRSGTLTEVTQVDAGGYHALALKDTGTVWGWGRGLENQVDGTTTSRTLPVQVQGVSGVKQVSAGGSHSLALKDDGTVRSWGSNSSGQLGNSTTTAPNSGSLSQVTGFTGGLQVSAGATHSLAVRADATPPTVALTAPTDGATVGGNVALSADASDNMGLQKVQFFANGESIGADVTAPYSINWNSSAYLDDLVSLEARAFDLAGNTATDTSTVRVDNTAPETTLSATGPADTTTDKTASFAFSSEAGTTFECSLDGSAFASCSSPKEYQNLGTGAHEFQVRALDAVGNADATPASRSWTVEPPPADPTVSRVTPTGKKVSPKANVTAVFSEAMDGTSIKAPGTIGLVRKGTTRVVAAVVTYDPTTSKATLNPEKSLVKGATYRATVTTGAKDLAGNPLAANKTWSFAVRR